MANNVSAGAETARYSAIAIILHWIIALAIIGQITLGFLMTRDWVAPAQEFAWYQLHKSTGVTILALSLLRLVWRLMNAPPALPAAMAGWEKFAARTTHFGFYVLMIGLPLTGWMIVSASPLGLPTIIWGVFELPHLPFFGQIEDRKAAEEALSGFHEFLAVLMIGLLVLHVGAALRHHYQLKDDVLVRMLPFLKARS